MLYDVVIIGAGLAGLQAAKSLRERGITNYIILESTDHIAGRAISRGAMWVHGHEKNPFYDDVVSNAGVRLAEADFCSPTSPTSYFYQGKPLDTSLAARFNALYAELLTQLELAESQSEIELPLSETITIIINKLFAEDDRLKPLFLQMALYRLAFYYGAETELVSTSGWASAEEFPGRQLVLAEGSFQDVFAKHYAAETEKVMFKHRVTDIAAPVGYEYIQVSTDYACFQASSVIVTVPLGVLKQNTINFSPALPPEKQKAINNLGFGLLTKLELEFGHCFWDQESSFIVLIDYDNAENSLNSGNVHYFMNMMPITGEPKLVAFAGGKDGQAYEYSATAGAAVESTLGALRTVYGADVVNAAYSKSSCSDWSTDENSYGAYTFIKEGQHDRDCKTLRKTSSLGNNRFLLFAGEATSPTHYSLLSGAYESGIAVAKEAYALRRQ